MFGLPGQTSASFAETLDTLLSFPLTHLSAYSLQLEEGTPLGETASPMEEDLEETLWTLLCQKAKEAGMEHYEISNFAKPGFESRHNLRYWQGLEYLGFGVAAHSYFEEKRFGYSRDIISFLDGKDITEECQAISENEKRREFVMLGLRLVKGISKAEYFQCFGRQLERDFHFERYAQAGFMTNNDDSIAFTEKGFLVSNAILAELIYGQ
jgi:oxygen-independent coproporphyrinogen-3 oxidase